MSFNGCKLKDRMTPNERMASLMQGKEIDRIPCVPMIGSTAAQYIGVYVREMIKSPELAAEAQIKAYQMFGHDSVGVTVGAYPMAVAFGGTTSDPLDENPAMVTNPIKTEEDLTGLDLPSLAQTESIRIPLETGKILLDKIGKEVGVGLVIGGPFTVAACLRGTSSLLRDTIRNPQFAHKTIDFAAQCVVQTAIPFLQEGIGPCIVDPVASGSILDPKKAAEFAFPYLSKVVQEFQKYTPGVILHICGDTTKLLGLMADTGAFCLSLDNAVDLEYAKQTVGDRVMLNGNVDPVNAMYLGTEETIHTAVKNCLRKAWDNPRGYILATGCDLPIKTPPENVAMLMDAVRLYGKWPLDPKNFK